jgi:hypothetical protein
MQRKIGLGNSSFNLKIPDYAKELEKGKIP